MPPKMAGVVGGEEDPTDRDGVMVAGVAGGCDEVCTNGRGDEDDDAVGGEDEGEDCAGDGVS